ncbi:MAG: ATP-binding cassette domain-containing protein, partial [Candidatus Binatia bacterium]
QHVTDGLDESSTVLEEVTRQSVLDDVTAVKNVLGNFFFSGDQVDKKIRVLSGGEKARVALAKLMVNPGNLLLMDEPTNHLDLESAEALAEALDGYDGTMVFVSHNLSFINRLATRIWDLRDGQVEEYPGTLEQYLQRFDFRVGVEEAVVEGGGVGRSNGDGAGAEEENPNAKPRRPGLSKNREQSLRGKVEELETRIAELEKSQAERGAELSKPEVFEDQSYYQRLLSEWTAAQSKIDELMARWEAAQNELAGEAPNGGG